MGSWDDFSGFGTSDGGGLSEVERFPFSTLHLKRDILGVNDAISYGQNSKNGGDFLGANLRIFMIYSNNGSFSSMGSFKERTVNFTHTDLYKLVDLEVPIAEVLGFGLYYMESTDLHVWFTSWESKRYSVLASSNPTLPVGVFVRWALWILGIRLFMICDGARNYEDGVCAHYSQGGLILLKKTFSWMIRSRQIY
ncbi:hypothetical protein DKX38_020612 [Salix brachista]|uniref:Uncharacterized protein n=1 Tax=Salix brachista TaxID=2182728 RepID=A0A5N5KB03_9ROSI|nr:hypothetical protein DKX38_020612 [Salix brachista]